MSVVVLAMLLPGPSTAAFTGAAPNPGNNFTASTLAAPTNVTARRFCPLLGTRGIEVKWQPSAGATGHDVLRSTTSGSGYTLIGQVGDPRD